MKRLLPLTLTLVLALSACAPTGSPTIETPIPSESPVPSGPLVYTDYSQLTPREKPEKPISKFTRRYAEFTDTLIPADDYGLLIPFPGAVVTRPEEDGWGLEDYNLYGLITLEGEVVVDPVFSSAYAPSHWDEMSQQIRKLDCLVLQKVVKDENGEPVDVAALCARDGSWCTGFDYSFDWEMLMDRIEENVIPMRRRGDGSRSLFSRDLAFLDVRTGEEVKTIDLGNVLERWPDAAWSLIYNLRYGERYAIFSDDTAHYLFDTETGEVQVLEELLNDQLVSPYSAPFYEGLCAVKTASGWGYIDGNGNWVTDPIYEEAQPFENGLALVRDEHSGGRYTYIDHQGKVVYTFPDGANNVYQSSVFLRYTLNSQAHYLDQNWKEVPLPGGFADPQVNGDWFLQKLADPSPTVPGGWAFWNVRTGVRQDFPGDWEYDYSISGNYALFHSRTNTRDYALADLATGELTPLGRWSYLCFRQDELTGEPYLQLSGFDDAESEWRRTDGSILYRTDRDWGWRVSFWDGKVFLEGEDAATLTDLKTGKILFSWPLHSAAD